MQYLTIRKIMRIMLLLIDQICVYITRCVVDSYAREAEGRATPSVLNFSTYARKSKFTARGGLLSA